MAGNFQGEMRVEEPVIRAEWSQRARIECVGERNVGRLSSRERERKREIAEVDTPRSIRGSVKMVVRDSAELITGGRIDAAFKKDGRKPRLFFCARVREYEIPQTRRSCDLRSNSRFERRKRLVYHSTTRCAP